MDVQRVLLKMLRIINCNRMWLVLLFVLESCGKGNGFLRVMWQGIWVSEGHVTRDMGFCGSCGKGYGHLRVM
jgi:hypothetical protein